MVGVPPTMGTTSVGVPPTEIHDDSSSKTDKEGLI